MSSVRLPHERKVPKKTLEEQRCRRPHVGLRWSNRNICDFDGPKGIEVDSCGAVVAGFVREDSGPAEDWCRDDALQWRHYGIRVHEHVLRNFTHGFGVERTLSGDSHPRRRAGQDPEHERLGHRLYYCARLTVDETNEDSVTTKQIRVIRLSCADGCARVVDDVSELAVVHDYLGQQLRGHRASHHP